MPNCNLAYVCKFKFILIQSIVIFRIDVMHVWSLKAYKRRFKLLNGRRDIIRRQLNIFIF